MSTELDSWDIQRPSEGNNYPKDVDFYLTEPAYWDLELFGEIWDNYCNLEAIQYNQKFTTNNNQPLTLTNWRPPRWLPGTGGVIPVGFVAKTYKVIIYIDAIRSGIVSIFTGEIDINDVHLIDKQGWFVPKIINVAPYTYIGIDQSIDIFCKIYQPCSSRLIITIQMGQEPPSPLYDEYISDQHREKLIKLSHMFTQWGLYTVKYKLITYRGNYMRGWCKPEVDYIEERQTIVEVGIS